jgi:hypothetical protein
MHTSSSILLHMHKELWQLLWLCSKPGRVQESMYWLFLCFVRIADQLRVFVQFAVVLQTRVCATRVLR